MITSKGIIKGYEGKLIYGHGSILTKAQKRHNSVIRRERKRKQAEGKTSVELFTANQDKMFRSLISCNPVFPSRFFDGLTGSCEYPVIRIDKNLIRDFMTKYQLKRFEALQVLKQFKLKP